MDLETRAASLRTIHEMAEAARRGLSKELWDYGFGGAETEATVRRNRWAIDAITFRPRVLQGHATPDLSTSFLGMPLALPVMTAPVGSIRHFHPEGALACARAAHSAGTAAWVSTLSTPSLEEVATAGQPLIFQLYVRGDREWLAALVRRAENAGYNALCLTADSAAYGRRERDLHNRFRSDGGAQANPNVGEAYVRHEYQDRLTWDDAAYLRRITKLPLIMKGIVTVEDAVLAVEHGVQAICVSNHGGRQMDYLPSTIEVLGEIVEAVGNHAEVVVDGGFLHGTDILKAVALGARAVCVGKAMLLALAAAGEPGLRRLFAILSEEMNVSMRLIGAGAVADLNPGYLRLPRFENLAGPPSPGWTQSVLG